MSMIVDLFGFSFIIETLVIYKLVFTSIIGIYIRSIFIILNKLDFLKTEDKLIVFALLPPTGFIITNVISNDIALSLGMVGALSIVRFRTPVKNPVELVHYFLLITLGIVANVSLSLAITFVLFITMLLIGIFCYTYFTGKDKVTNYLSGTGEKFTLNLRLKKEISNQYDNIVHFSMDENKNFLYIFQSPNKEYLSLIIEELDKNDLISFSID